MIERIKKYIGYIVRPFILLGMIITCIIVFFPIIIVLNMLGIDILSEDDDYEDS